MQNACDERETCNSCLVCWRCVVQSGLQKSQRDAFRRRLWSSVNYVALPYLLELHERWYAYRSQCTPLPPSARGLQSNCVVEPTVSIARSDVSNSTFVCQSVLSHNYKQFDTVKCKLWSVDSLFNGAGTFWAVLSRTLAQLVTQLFGKDLQGSDNNSTKCTVSDWATDLMKTRKIFGEQW